MRLLITTQTVNQDDPVLGFFHAWIEEFAKRYEQVTVICLYEGRHSLPANVRIYSLGKEKGAAHPLRYAIRFKALAWKLRHDYDAVFVHMNPEYIVIAGLLWRLMHKRIALWYLHKSVSLRLRAAVLFADVVLSASPESFRLPTKKLHIVGHGIDFSQYIYQTPRAHIDSPRFITVGRITPAKGIHDIFDALKVGGLNQFTYDLYGGPAVKSDAAYLQQLGTRAAKEFPNAHITFHGPVPPHRIPEVLRDHDLFLHASRGTGSVDKVVLESLAAGVLVLSMSGAFESLLSPHQLYAKSTEELASILQGYLSRTDSEVTARALSEEVRAHNALPALITRITGLLNNK